MKLTYHEGQNFGDAINPLIFKTLLPGFFDDNNDIEFIGIGSILGLKRPSVNTKKMIVFSSGFGGGDSKTYGTKPSDDDLKKYDFRCVRGALTANYFGLDEKLAICDGAILLPKVISCPRSSTKMHLFSYIPHVSSLIFYPELPELLTSVGINVIDPRDDINKIIDEIQASETLFTEAMHGAIVADALRVPWVPIFSNSSINFFKWNDFGGSLNLQLEINRTQTLYSQEFLEKIATNKMQRAPNFINKAIALGYKQFQNQFIERKVIAFFKNLKETTPILSDSQVLANKQEQLLEKLSMLSKDYL
jgi:succinoglycan biosynthesis protein ExoV